MSALDRVVVRLRRDLGDRVSTAVQLRDHTTYRVGGPAAVFVEVETVDDLETLAATIADEEVAVLPLGRGSNLVVADEGFPGVVIHLGPRFSGLRGDGVTLVAGGGAPLPQLANRAARRGLSGLEFAIAIPGSVGGGVRMNAGAHGGEVADHLTSIRLFDVARRTLEERSAGELGFSYRCSNLTDVHVVVEARWDLPTGDPAAIKDRTEVNRRHRAETQPGAVQNAGSVFKNPPGDHAGRLVEAAGLKGFSVGNARVSELHANFFIAGEGSTARDVFDLVRAVQARVAERSGVQLETEIRFVGTFE